MNNLNDPPNWNIRPNSRADGVKEADGIRSCWCQCWDWLLLAGFSDSAHQGKGVTASFLQERMEGHASHLASSPLAPGRRPKQETFCPTTQASTGALTGGWRAEKLDLV